MNKKEAINASTSTDHQLELRLDKVFSDSKLSGLSVVAANDKGIVFQKSYGYADIKNKKPYSNDTIHNIGSVSKTFIGLALMQAVDDGILQLDDDINRYLPFKVVNPYFPEDKITIRHLTHHTATINDDANYPRSYVFDNPQSVDLSLYNKDTQEYFSQIKANQLIDEAQLLENIFSTQGKWHTKRNFINNKPGEKYLYSNLGATLAAYVLERATGIAYENYVQEKIFKPLNMHNSWWKINDTNRKDFASRYFPNNIKVPDYQLITKADGAIITSTNDMANYISEMLNGINGKGKLLSKQAYKTLFTLEVHGGKKEAIFWSSNKLGNPQHSGADPGVLTVLALNPAKNIGVFLMTNISADEDKGLMHSIKEILRALKRHNW
jgi:CubicO group peptidase (beta-lactamase class C family)